MKKRFILIMLLSLPLLLLAAQGSITLSAAPSYVSLISETADGLIVAYNIDKLEYQELDTPEGRFTDLFIQNYSTTNLVGLPRLPLQRQIIAVPEAATVVPRIVSAQRQTISLSGRSVHYPIMPFQESVSKSALPEDVVFEVDRDYYNRSVWTDHQSISVTELGNMRGMRLFALDFVPVRYNPAQNQIEVIHQAEVRVDFEGADHLTTMDLRERYYSPAFNSIYSSTLLNPVQTRASLNRYPMGYLIITPSNFVSALQPFVDWKVKEGFDVTVATLDQTGSTAAAIKSYLQNIWNSATTQNPAPSYLLIVGDVAQVPSNTGATATSHITDLTYVRLQGTDYLPEMYFSRFSATTPSEVTNQVNKTLMHETYSMPDDSYLATTVLIAGVDSSWSNTHANGQVNYGTTNYFNSSHGINSINYLYPASGSSASQIVANVSAGAGYVNYTAHGSETSWYDPSFTISNVNNLQNTYKYPVVIGNCCVTNAFNTSICFGEAWLRAVDKGGVVYIGGTNNTYWDEDYWWAVGYKPPVVGSGSPFIPGRTGNYDALFHEHNEPFEDWSNSVGATTYMGNMAVVQANSSLANYYWEVYSIMGDASLIPYMGIPQQSSAQFMDTIFLGTSSMDIVADPYSYVALSMNGVLRGVGLVDQTGQLTLNYTPFTEPGTAQIVITRSLMKPLIANIQVVPNEGPYVTVGQININDPNGNGLAEPGEIISMNLSFNNVGVMTATNLSASLNSSSQWVNILSASAPIPNVPSGETINVSDIFSVQISPMVPDQITIPFEITVTDGTHTWASIRNVISYASDVQVVQTNILDSNGNGFYESGETITIQLQLANNGHLAIGGGSLEVVSNSDGITFVDTSIALPPMSIGANTQISIIGFLANGLETGSVISIGIAISAGAQMVNHTVSLPIGKIGEDFESGSFTSYPWVNNSSVPWTIQSSTVHSGSYAAKSGAIGNSSNTALSISRTNDSASQISFWCKVSSEGGYDVMRFYINNEEKGAWSGNQDWVLVSFPVTAGTNTFKWEYKKDYSVSSGSDCAWLDDIIFPLSASGDAAIFYCPVDEISFTDVSSGSTVSTEFVIRNLGNATMHGMIAIPSSFILMQGNTILPSEYTYDLLAAENGVFTIKYVAPTPAVEISDVIIITSNDESNPAVMIPIIVEPVTANDDHTIPSITRLEANYPNPFNPQTTISFSLRESGPVRIDVYNLKGQHIRRLVDTKLNAGTHRVVFDGKDSSGRSISSGIYLYRMESEGYSKTMKMMLMK